MCLIADEKQQPNTAKCRNGQPNVFNTKTLGNLRHESVDRQGDDEEEVQTDEGKGVTGGESRVAGQLAESKP